MGENGVIIRISTVISYIEDNIREDITLDCISRYVGLSRFYLERVFNTMTDMTLMNYVRCRKLVHSISSLLNTELRIIDIAQEFNFNYEQNYIRAFRKTFGISPSKFRRQKPVVEIIPKINPEYMTPIGENGVVFYPKFILKPEFKLIGKRFKVNLEENMTNFMVTGIAIDFYLNRAALILDKKYPEVFIGYIEIIPDIASHRYYIPSMEVASASHIPDGMEAIDVPGGYYAVFKYIGLHSPQDITVDKLNIIYDYILRIWLRKSGYRFNNKYWFERVDMKNCRQDYCEFEMWFPIEAE